jgi:hypothetical protein
MSKMNIAVGIKGLKAGTKLNEIVVPKEMRVRMSCGISWLDDALGEGFVASTVAMFTGTPGWQVDWSPHAGGQPHQARPHRPPQHR